MFWGAQAASLSILAACQDSVASYDRAPAFLCRLEALPAGCRQQQAASLHFPEIRSLRTRTSTIPHRAQISPASPQDRHLYLERITANIGRTGPGHQRRAHLRLSEQPHLQLRQKNKLLENGTLQIVYESLISELLSCVRDTGNFSGILPARICPFRWHGKSRLQQQDRQLFWQLDWRDQLASSTTDGGRLKNKEWNV